MYSYLLLEERNAGAFVLADDVVPLDDTDEAAGVLPKIFGGVVNVDIRGAPNVKVVLLGVFGAVVVGVPNKPNGKVPGVVAGFCWVEDPNENGDDVGTDPNPEKSCVGFKVPADEVTVVVPKGLALVVTAVPNDKDVRMEVAVGLYGDPNVGGACAGAEKIELIFSRPACLLSGADETETCFGSKTECTPDRCRRSANNQTHHGFSGSQVAEACVCSSLMTQLPALEPILSC